MLNFKTWTTFRQLLLATLVFGLGQLRAQDSVEQLEEQAIRQAIAGIDKSLIRFETIGGTARVEGHVVSNGPATGLVVSKDGYALSASFHFANQPATIFARLPNGQRAVAEIVGRDQSRKIVLLKIQTDFEFSIPDMATTRVCRVGQTVIAVGRVFDPEFPNVSTGIISAENRIWDKAIQTDAKISPANFGGPLLDLEGTVMGILVPMNPDRDREMDGTEWYDSGIGFAVPITDLLKRLDDLKKGRILRRGLMGVSLTGNDIFADRAVVAFCRGSSPAGKSGIRPGDEITEINGRSISRQSEMKHALGPLYDGDVANVTVLRNGERLEFDVELAGEIAPFVPPGIGLILSRESNAHLVVQTSIKNQAAEIAGVKKGDLVLKVNGAVVANFEDLRLMIAASEIDSKLNLTVARNGESQEIVIMVEKRESGLLTLFSNGNHEPRSANVIDINIADVPNACYAIVPEQKNGDAAPALLVWIPEPGKLIKEDLENEWLDHCRMHNVVLLIPESTESNRWSSGEIGFVISAVDKLAKQVRFDRKRIVMGGTKTGGSMASLIVFAHRELFRGLILLNSGLSKRVGLVETSPVEPLLVLLGTHDRQEDSLKASIARLKGAHIPFHLEHRIDGMNVSTWIGDILNWVNAVDRL